MDEVPLYRLCTRHSFIPEHKYRITPPAGSAGLQCQQLSSLQVSVTHRSEIHAPSSSESLPGHSRTFEFRPILSALSFFFFFFITLGLELSDTKVYEP